MKRNIMLCLIFLLSVLLTAGCSQKKKKTDKLRTEIVLWHYWDIPHNQKQLSELVRNYNKSQQEVKVIVKYIPDEDLKKQLALSMADGTMPDLALVDSADFQYFHSLKEFADLTEEIDEQAYFPEALDSCRVEGRIYGLPFGLNCPALIYNKKMFNKHHLRVPETWDEVYRAAVELTDHETYGFGITALQSEETMYEFLPILWSMGGRAGNISSPESRKAFELLVKLVDKKAMSRQCISLTLGDLMNQFIKGNVAMMLNSPMTIDTIRKENPELDFGIAPIPSGKQSVSVIGGEVLAVTKGRHEKEAVSFVRYLSQKKNMENYLDGFGFLAPRKDVFREQFSGDEKKKSFKEIYKTARPREFTKKWPSVSKTLSDCISDIIIDGKNINKKLNRAADKIKNTGEE